MAEKLLEKIPPKKRWEITANIIGKLFVMRGEKIIAPVLGKGEGIISHIWGAEKWQEIHEKIWGDGGAQLSQFVKETFNIPVEDAVGAAKVFIICETLIWGPESKHEIVEENPERVVVRITKCPNWEKYEEFEVDPAFIPCLETHIAAGKEGCKAINPKLTYKLMKARPRGDPYCEDVFELKEE